MLGNIIYKSLACILYISHFTLSKLHRIPQNIHLSHKWCLTIFSRLFFYYYMWEQQVKDENVSGMEPYQRVRFLTASIYIRGTSIWSMDSWNTLCSTGASCYSTAPYVLAGTPSGPVASLTHTRFSSLTTASSTMIYSSLVFRTTPINSVYSVLKQFCLNFPQKLVNFIYICGYVFFGWCAFF